VSNKVYVHRIGVSAGFYSELNMMVLALVYCYSHNISFKLYSDSANFAPERGWREFFQPFCEEVHERFHRKYNLRTRYSIVNRGRRHLSRYAPHFLKVLDGIASKRERHYKRRYGIDYLTCDLFQILRSEYSGTAINDKMFDIAELGLKGDFRDVARGVIERIYRFNPETEAAVCRIVSDMCLPARYVGFQIRGGDKHYETCLRDVNEYLRKAESLTETRDAFLSTDDYRLFESAQRQNPSWKFSTLCKPDEHGYDHAKFIALPFEQRKFSYLTLFACIDILKRSEHFVGTLSSNLGLFLATCMDRERFAAIDFPEFHYWWPQN